MPRGPGSRMMACLAYVAEHPGCSKSDAARCGKEGPLFPGSVTALLRRGLVSDQRAGGRYRLHVTPAGQALAAGPVPGMMLLASDALACPAVSAYYELCVKNGAPAVYLAGVEAVYTALAGWQEAHPARVRMPGAPGGKPEEG